MKIKNLTNSPRELNATVLTKDGVREISIYVLGNSVVEIEEGVVVNNLQTLLDAQAVEVLDKVIVKEVPVVLTETKEDTEEPETEKEDTEQVGGEATPEEPEEEEPSDILCPVCGDKFSSDRGLKAHVRIKHPEKKKEG